MKLSWLLCLMKLKIKMLSKWHFLAIPGALGQTRNFKVRKDLGESSSSSNISSPRPRKVEALPWSHAHKYTHTNTHTHAENQGYSKGLPAPSAHVLSTHHTKWVSGQELHPDPLCWRSCSHSQPNLTLYILVVQLHNYVPPKYEKDKSLISKNNLGTSLLLKDITLSNCYRLLSSILFPRQDWMSLRACFLK